MTRTPDGRSRTSIPGSVSSLTNGRAPPAGIAGPSQRAPDARPAVEERARRPERGLGHPRGGRRRQDGPPAVLRWAGVRYARRASRGRRGRDGVAVCGTASALRTDVRSARRSSGAPARRFACRFRHVVRGGSRQVPGRAGRAQPVVCGRRGATAAVPRRGGPVARCRIRPGPRVRGAAAAGGVGGPHGRPARAGRQAGVRGPARAAARRA